MNKKILENMKGKIIKDIFLDLDNIFNFNLHKEYENIYFVLSNNDVIQLYHEKECCESVYLQDIVGNLKDLIGSEILLAEESSSEVYELGNKKDAFRDHETWTFYKFATKNGYVTLWWYGTSNGAYSECVDMKYIKSENIYFFSEYFQ